MTNPPRIIGTRAESAIVKVAKANGFPKAMRLPLSGRLDCGDILLNPGARRSVYIQSKAGDKAKKASDNQIIAWLDKHTEAMSKAGMLGVTISGFLVVPRVRRSPAFWWAIRYEGTRVVYEWLESALKAERAALQLDDSTHLLYGGDPKVVFEANYLDVQLMPFLDSQLRREAEASVKLDGETQVVGYPRVPYSPSYEETNHSGRVPEWVDPEFGPGY